MEHEFVEREPFYLFDDEFALQAAFLRVTLVPRVFYRLLKKVERNPLTLTRHELVDDLGSNWKSLKKYENYARASHAVRLHCVPDRRGYVYKVGEEYETELKKATALGYVTEDHL